MSQTSSLSIFEGRKEERLNSGVADQVSIRTFYTVMCATLLWGFLVNALLVAFFADSVRELLAQVNPWVFVIGFLAISIGGIVLAVSSNNPAFSFLGYNMLVLPMGLELCLIVPAMSAAVVVKALLLTGIVTATMTLLGIIRPQVFLGLGRTLFIALLVGLVAELVAVFVFHYTGTVFEWLFVIIFSGYIGYDVAKAQMYPKTVDNAIDCALDIYIDVINLFVILLRLFSREN